MTKRPSDERSADTGATFGRQPRRAGQNEPATTGKHARSVQPTDQPKSQPAGASPSVQPRRRREEQPTRRSATSGRQPGRVKQDESAAAGKHLGSTQPRGAQPMGAGAKKAAYAEKATVSAGAVSPEAPKVTDLGESEVEWPELGETSHHGLYRRRHSRRREKRRKRLKIAAIVILVLVLLIGGTALGIWYLISAGEQSVRASAQAEDLETADDAETDDDGYTVVYDGKIYRYNEDVVSIVFMGYDRREDVSETGAAGQADAVMVVALDVETGEISVIGVPRDSMVYVDEMVGEAFIGQEEMQLALAYSYGDGYETSAENVVRAVKRILYNMPMNYYVAINMEGVGALNDAVGGITLTPLETIPNTSIVEGTTTTLYGTNAVKYVQYRDTSQLDSALQRQARQSQYLKTFFSQAMSSATGSGGVSVLVSLYQTALEYATANLEVQELAYLATVLLQNGVSELEVTTLEGEVVMGDEYAEYYLDEESVYQTVLDVFYTLVGEVDTDTATDADTETSAESE